MKEICANCKLRFHCDRHFQSIRVRRARKNIKICCPYFYPDDRVNLK
jgi:hypothetical protein